MSQTSLVQADLRFLLPIRKGEDTLVVGDPTTLAESLRSEGVCVTTLGDGAWRAAQDAGRSVDIEAVPYVLIPRLSPALLDWAEDGLRRHLEPGGWLLMGCANAEGLQRWRPSRTAREHGRTVTFSRRGCTRWLESQGLRAEQFFGVIDDLGQPRVLVPLAQVGASRYYFGHMYVPHTASAAWALRLARWLIALRLHRVLFRDLVVVARRPEDS